MKFPCQKCSLCCRHIDRAVNLFTEAGFDIKFPYKWTDGVCEMLKDNLCSVYENRPLICNVDRYIKENKINKHWFYKLNIEACNRLMDEAGLDQKYRINIKSK